MARCRVHPESEVVDTLDDDFAYSVFRPVNGEPTLTFNLRVKIELVPRDVRVVQDCDRRGSRRACPTYECETPPPEAFTDFKNDFRQAINDFWNGRLLLVDRRRTRGTDPLHVNCAVNIEFVNNDEARPHVRVGMLYNPTIVRGTEMPEYGYDDNFYRGNCARRGHPDPNRTDMRLMWEAPGCFERYRRPRPNDEPIRQNAAAHEFGHYLGYGHTCQIGPTSTGEPREYCLFGTREQQESVMAYGNRLDPPCADAWRDRLALQHQQCEVPWIGAVYT
jgi:hypothetical protein